MKRGGLILVLMSFVGFMVWGCSCRVCEKEAAPPAPVVSQEAPQKQGPTPEELRARELARLRQMELERQRRIEAMAKAFEQKDIHFDFDKYDLKPEARATLRELANFLLEHPEFRVRIEGNCDERGTEEYNLALGEKRASAARDYLVSLGVSPDRIDTISYGESRPVCTEHNESCWWRNRRDHFVLIKVK